MADDEKSSHKCVLCNNVLASKVALQEHFRKHANKEIDDKGKATTSDEKKKAILKKETVKEPIVDFSVACDVCGRLFSNSRLAIQHKFKAHPEVSIKYFCSYCGMQFTIKSLLDKHVEIHSCDLTPKGSFHCDACNVDFFFESAMQYHIESTHKRVMRIFQPVATAPPSKKIRMNNAGEIQSVYYCHLCGSEYIVKFNLQKHLEKTHTEEERSVVPKNLIKCTTCEALFYNQKAYEIHNITHSPTDLYVTSEEQRLQTVSRVDQDFDIRRVLPLEEEYINSYKIKRSRSRIRQMKEKEMNTDKPDSSEELSPPCTPDSSDVDESDDSDVPLVRLVQKLKQTGGKRKTKVKAQRNTKRGTNV